MLARAATCVTQGNMQLPRKQHQKKVAAQHFEIVLCLTHSGGLYLVGIALLDEAPTMPMSEANASEESRRMRQRGSSASSEMITMQQFGDRSGA